MWFSEVLNIISPIHSKTPWHKKKNCNALLKLINGDYKILWLKRTATIWRTDQKTPQTSYRNDLMSLKEEQVWAILADFCPYGKEVNEKIHIPTKNPKTYPFVIKAVLRPNCKRFRKSAIRENFDLKPKTRMEKNHHDEGGKNIHQYNEVKEKL